MVDDDIYNRIMKFKAKNEKIIKMNRNYRNVDKKKYGELNMFMSIMLMKT